MRRAESVEQKLMYEDGENTGFTSAQFCSRIIQKEPKAGAPDDMLTCFFLTFGIFAK